MSSNTSLADKVSALIKKDKSASTLTKAEKITIVYCVLFLVAVAAIDTYFLLVYRKNHSRYREKDKIPVPPAQATKHPTTTNYSWKVGQQCFQLTNVQNILSLGNCAPGHTWIYNDKTELLTYRDSYNHRCIEAYNSSKPSSSNQIRSVTEDNSTKCKGVKITKDSTGNNVIVSNGSYVAVDSNNNEIWTTNKSNEQAYVLEPL